MRNSMILILGIFLVFGSVGIGSAAPSFTTNFSAISPSLTIQFYDSTIGASSWQWNFGDGSANSTAQNPVHTYAAYGNYTVTLTAAGGTTAKLCDFRMAKPVVSYTTQVDYLTVTYYGSAEGVATSWHWDFGDGNTSTTQNTTHQYSQLGNYPVTLSVTNAAGTTTYTQTVDVVHSPQNYSRYLSTLYTENMTTWDFATNTRSFYALFIPDQLLMLLVLLIPFYTMYARQRSIIVVSVIYLIVGGVISAAIMPAFSSMAFWCLSLGATGVFYKLFVSRD